MIGAGVMETKVWWRQRCGCFFTLHNIKMLRVGKEKDEGNSDNVSEFISLCLQEVTLLSAGYFWPMRASTDAYVFRVRVYTHTHTTISLDGLSAAAPLIRQLDGWRHVATKV